MRAHFLSAFAIALLLFACGDDTSTTDTGTPPGDTGTPPGDTGTPPGDSATDTGGATDAPPGDAIPTIVAECGSTSCTSATGGNVYLAYVNPSCAAIFDDMMDSTAAAGRAAPYTCSGAICTATSDDGPAPWEDEAENPVTTLAAGMYGVAAWFDHNGNFATSGGPDAGDTVCCEDIAVDASTTSVTVSAGCIDI